MTQRWGAPSGTARKVLATVGTLALLAVGGCADPAGGSGAYRADEASESPVPTPVRPDPSGAVIDPEPAPGETPAPTPVGGRPWDAEVTAACEQALAGQDGAGEDWAGQEVAQTANDGGVTSFWADGTRWVLCDRLLGADAPPPVLVVSGPPDAGLSGRALLLGSTLVSGADGEPAAVRLVAGGRLPWPVAEIGYAFPDGHTENAAFVRSDDGAADTWWSVTYTATDGVLVDPGDEADLAPLVVSVVGGAAEAFRLPWDEALRAQRSE